MAEAAVLRKYAAEHGKGSVRGTLPRALITEWNTAHPDDPYEPGAPRDPERIARAIDDDLDAMFTDMDDTGGVYREPELAETPPRPVPKARAKGKSGGGLRGLLGGQPPAGKSKKKTPRVSTEDLLGSLWRGAAKLATPLPPLHRTLRIQAPVAGLLLEDAVKDTAADTFLQPLARMASAGKTLNALLGPPAFVTAMSVEMLRAGQEDRAPNPVFMALAEEGLRSSLMAWLDVAGPKFEQAVRREREFEAKYGAQVDDYIQWLFSPPPSTVAEAEAEQAMYAKATGAGQPAGF